MKILVLDDGFKGNFNQASGIAQAFPSAIIKILKVKLKGPSYYLPSRKGSYPIASKVLSVLCILRAWKSGRIILKLLLTEKWVWKEHFDMIISAGSVLAPVNLIISKDKKANSINVMVPALVPLKLFDFAVIPYHDFLRLRNKRLKNLIVTMGAPNCITDRMLEEKRKRLKNILSIPQDKEIIGILIGGDDQNYKISVRWAELLLDAINPLKESYGFIITTSRRTKREVVSFIQKKVKDDRAIIYAEFPGYTNISYYPGILSLCRYILVTEDSVNMVSEAATSGNPVIILGVERKKEKRIVFDITLENLVKKGYAEYLGAEKLNTLEEKLREISGKKYNKLNEAEECVRKILEGIR